MAGGVFAYLSGAWRRGHSFDAWDPSAGVWRDVKEIWGFSGGFWRQHYRRAYFDSVSNTFEAGDPDYSHTVNVTVGGIAAGTVTCIVRFDGVEVGGGTIVTPNSASYGILGTSSLPATGDVRILSARGRVLDTVSLTF